MIKRSILTILIAAALSAAVFAQVHEPLKGSRERKLILEALRVPVERDLKQSILFNADHFKVAGKWAYVSGSPQAANGGRPDYSKTKYAAAVDSGAFDHNFFGLLKRTAGKWKTVAVAIGCTDVCSLDWPHIYRAPKAIFPFPE